MILGLNRVAVRAMEVSGPPFCTEFRSGSNGTSPGPENPNFLGGEGGLGEGSWEGGGWVGEGGVGGFVGSWVALGFVWVSFPRANSEGFSFSC